MGLLIPDISGMCGFSRLALSSLSLAFSGSVRVVAYPSVFRRVDAPPLVSLSVASFYREGIHGSKIAAPCVGCGQKE